jgi:carbamoyltransferase
MRVLGLHCGHNATVFLLDDGVVKAGLSQEKLDDVKNSAGFPADAIRAMLVELDLRTEDIDEVAIAGHDVYPQRCYDYLFRKEVTDDASRTGLVGLARKLDAALIGKIAPELLNPLRHYRQKSLVAEGRRELRANLAALGLDRVPVTHIDHHTCHARAAFHGLGGEGPALIFTADGSGDDASAKITLVDERGHWTELGVTPLSSSLGGIYSATTRFLGMRTLEHEYKVMGLAPYAKEYADAVYKRVFEPAIDLDPANPFAFRAKTNCMRFYDHLVKVAVGERFDNLAAAVQRLIEERVLAWVEHAVAKAGVRKAYFGGGLFMNVKLNMRIQELACLEEAHFMPSCGDESNALGAAYAVQQVRGPVQPLENLYLGLSYGADEIEHCLARQNVRSTCQVDRPDDLNERVAVLLAEGRVVARFAGRNEWGARSLGNRAILAHPGRMESFYTINDQIKCRDFWMPFAPTILDSAAPKYLENWSIERTPAPYMITAFKATPLGQKELRAAIHHGDGTVRPQVLRRDANPDYYDLVKRFENKTGIGAVLNTSFNLHGKPLAATPEQALDTLRHSDLRYLAIGPFLVSKNDRA